MMFTFITSQMLACSVSHSKEGRPRATAMKQYDVNRVVDDEKKHLETVLDLRDSLILITHSKAMIGCEGF
jgi:hypothetical protein